MRNNMRRHSPNKLSNNFNARLLIIMDNYPLMSNDGIFKICKSFKFSIV